MNNTLNEGSEKLTDTVKRLTKELEIKKALIQNCKHTFTDPIPATREYKEPIFLRYEPHGSDPEPIYDWITKVEHGWRRECTTCGYEQYTAKLKPKEPKDYVPDFK